MIITNHPVSVIYTDTEFRNLIEQCITQQKSEFTLKGLCDLIFIGQSRMVNRKN